MEKGRDHGPTGRMLFTDLDASEKGRPMVADPVVPAPVDVLNARLPTLEELASSLDLDFEDDWGVEPAGNGGAQIRSRVPADTPAFESPREETRSDDEPATPSESSLVPRASRPASATGQSPTWEEFIQSFHRAEPAGLTSRLDDGFFRTAFAARKQPTESAKAPIGTSLSDPEEEDWEMDILSQLSTETADDGEAWKGQRLGLAPPRTKPYAGLTRLEEWFKPPEETAPRPPESPKDWYEPPAEPSREDVITAAFAAPAEPRRERSTSTRLDMFSDIDLDKLWEEKLRQANSNRAGKSETTKVSRRLDLFSDINLEEIWEEKMRRTASGRLRAPPPRDTRIQRPDAATTLIMGKNIVDNATTVIMPSDDVAKRAPSDTRQVAKPRQSPATRSRKTTGSLAAPPKPPTGSGLNFLEDEGSFAKPTELRDDVSAGSSPRKDTDTLPARIEDLDIAHLLADAPQDSTGEIGENSASAAITTAGATPMADADEPDDEEFAALLAAADAEARAEEEEKEKRRKRFNPDDLINSLDLDSITADVAADVAAPIIDDSAIFNMPQSGTRPTEAPEPVADLPDDPVAADANEAGDTPEVVDGESEKPAAMDPMDVFSKLENMDFSADGGLDDEMKAMLEEDAEGETPDAAPKGHADVPTDATSSARPRGKVGKLLGRILPAHLLDRLQQAVAWQENWWFYCDLLSAIIASASLAVIISYYIWYR